MFLDFDEEDWSEEDLLEWQRIAERRSEIRLTIHETAEIIADLFGDPCACNYNDHDEWLPNYCEYTGGRCPNPGGVACWEQYLIHRDKRSGAN